MHLRISYATRTDRITRSLSIPVYHIHVENKFKEVRMPKYVRAYAPFMCGVEFRIANAIFEKFINFPRIFPET